MDQIQTVLVQIRKKFMKAIVDVTDPGYFLLMKKSVPLSKEETEFVQIYQNTFALHTLAIISTLPGTVYFTHYYKAQRKVPIDEKRLRWAKRGILMFTPLAMGLVSTAFAYQKMNRFEPKLKEIEQYYLDHKEIDINQLSFTYKEVQNL